MAYVALKRLRFGDRWLNPGDEVPDESGRNYNLMLRQGLVADLDTIERSDEAHAAQVAGFKLRIRTLESQLGEAHGEIAALRAGTPVQKGAEKVEGEPQAASTEPDPGSTESPVEVNLEELAEAGRDRLVEVAEGLGITVASNANKGRILGLIEAKVKGEG